MSLEYKNTAIQGLIIFQPQVFVDERGYFMVSYNKQEFKDAGIDYNFVQDNLSCSAKGSLRGLHFQNPPFAQGKLLSVLRGAVLDVAVDIRKDSPSFGKHFSIVLSENNKTIFCIPPGFAHGFLALEDNTLFSYKCTADYSRQSEGSISWNDPNLNINWGINDPLISEKDAKAPLFKDFKSEF